MACSFLIPFLEAPDVLISKAKTAILQAGGTLTGDTSSGSFYISTPLGNVKGTYTITGQNLNVEISHRPFLIGCESIKTRLSTYLLQLQE